MTDLVTELLLTLELALAHDDPAVHQRLDRVEQLMDDAIDAVFAPGDEPVAC